MDKRAWLGGLVLSVGGWVAGLGAQEAGWRPAERPAAPARCASRYVVKPAPAGAVVRGQSPDEGRAAGGAGGSQFAADREPTAPPPGLDRPIVLASAQEPASDALPAAAPPPAAPDLLPATEPGPDLPGVPLPPIGTAPASPAAVLPPRPPLGRPPEGRLAAGPEVVTQEPARQPALPDRAPDLLPPPHPEPAPAAWGPVNPALDFHPKDLPPFDPNPACFYARAEFLLWWLKPDQVPPLVTAGNPNLLNPADPTSLAGRGILGQPGTTLLFGNENRVRDPHAGLRFALGFWCDCEQDHGFEVEGFVLFNNQKSFAANSNDFPVLARPVQVANMGNVEGVELVALPGVTRGIVTVRAPSEMWGITPDFRCKLCCGCDSRIDLLAGFRYTELNEALSVTEDVIGSPAAPAPLTNQQAHLVDSFSTRNQFYGAEIGLAGERRWGPWSLDWRGKLAIGDNHQTVLINGTTVLTDLGTGQVRTFQGGLLALSTNIGRFERDRFSVIPELNLNVGYDVTEHIRLSMGYTFLYWSDVVRPGDQIDRVVDFTKVPSFQPLPAGFPAAPQNRPAVLFRENDFYAHGLNFSVLFKF
jgi:hypothetical protein